MITGYIFVLMKQMRGNSGFLKMYQSSVPIFVCEHQGLTSFIKLRVVRNRQTDIGKKKKIENVVVDNEFI